MSNDGLMSKRQAKINKKLAVCLAALMAWLLGVAPAVAQIRLVDAADSLPVVGAMVSTLGGRYLGMTDEEGRLPKEAEAARRLSLRHVAYQTRDVSLDTLKADVVTMALMPLQMAEVEVQGPKITHKYMRSYYRFVQTRDSVVQYVREGYFDSFLDLKKNSVKGHIAYERFLVAPNVGRKYNGKLHADAFLNVIEIVADGKLPKAADIQRDADSVTADAYYTHDRYGHVARYVRRPRGQGMTYVFDNLMAGEKEQAQSLWMLKMFGYKKMVVTENTRTQSYLTSADTTANGKMVGSFLNMRIECQLKHDGAPHDYLVVGEIYDAETRYVTKEQRDTLWKHPDTSMPIAPPAAVPALPAWQQRAVEQMTESHEKDGGLI